MHISLKSTHSVPERATDGSFGYDLATIEKVTVWAREYELARTGLTLTEDLQVDQYGGMGAFILPRSSLFIKHRLVIPNSPGLIDADYGEEIKVLLYNPEGVAVSINAGTRIAQLVFMPVYFPVVLNENVVELTADTNRIRGGFGSTGE